MDRVGTNTFPDGIKFRFLVDDDREDTVTLVTEPYGREIPVRPGAWVDIECNNGDGTPVEVWARSDGSIAVYAREVIVTDEAGYERIY